MKQVRAEAQATPTHLVISLDAKATIPLGEFSRRGSSRTQVKAFDHDFQPNATVTPFGLFLPLYDELHLTLTPSKVSSDFIVDTLETFWTAHKARFAEVDTLVLLLDNGPENQSRRTQFMARLVAFAHTHQKTVKLAYYPPYHSKYNPIERVWGVLEMHWNGALLDQLETVVRYAESMTYRGVHPVVRVVSEIYEAGVRLSRKAMAALETQFHRLPGLELYFVTIPP